MRNLLDRLPDTKVDPKPLDIKPLKHKPAKEKYGFLEPIPDFPIKSTKD